MARKISFGLSVREINAAQKQLSDYKKQITQKCEEFAKRLCDAGILVATQNTGSYGKYITFYSEITSHGSGIKAVLAATNTGLLKSEWRTRDGTKSVDVSPLLMAEFGSGLKADNPRAGEFGMGTGTFPGQTHAGDPEGWWYMDLDGEWHHSYGVTPTMPMCKASQEMIKNVRRIAKEVFGGV